MRSEEVLEQAGLDVIGADAAWRCDQGADLAPADIPATPELDARQAPVSRPRPDRPGPEVHVGCGEDLGGLVQRDPVGGGRHGRQSEPPDDGPDDVEESDDAPDPEPPDEFDEFDEFDELTSAPPPDPPSEPPPELPAEPPSLARFESLEPEDDDPARVLLEPPRSFLAQPEPL
jgi:hypothetical protein